MQILVVVANIQMGTLKTEVGKGSRGTAVGPGLVGPKRRGSSGNKAGSLGRERESGQYSRTGWGSGGDADKLGDANRSSGKSFLF